MEENLLNSLLTVCTLLKKYEIPYVLIGGTAVALNGYFRMSTDDVGELIEKPDIDIWYNPTYKNYFNILKVMEHLGYDIAKFKNEKSPNPKKSFFKLDFENFSLDILPTIKANLNFNDVYNRKKSIEINGELIYFMNHLDLIMDKETNARKKDLIDIEELKKINGINLLFLI
jgi:hypothetical protein